MGDELITFLVDVDQGAEGAVADLVLRAGVDERALAARKGRLFMLVLEQILAKTRPDFLEQPAQATDDRIVAANRMQRLAQVVEADTRQPGRGKQQDHGPARGQGDAGHTRAQTPEAKRNDAGEAQGGQNGKATRRDKGSTAV